jgi:hypothetical protein
MQRLNRKTQTRQRQPGHDEPLAKTRNQVLAPVAARGTVDQPGNDGVDLVELKGHASSLQSCETDWMDLRLWHLSRRGRTLFFPEPIFCDNRIDLDFVRPIKLPPIHWNRSQVANGSSMRSAASTKRSRN